jgi:cytoskeletal protein CcmA (bactofilin family)
MFSKKPEPSFPAAPPRRAANASTFSVLSADVTMRGNVEAAADLHLDGTVEGDVTCATLVQGETGRIAGAIEAQSARLAGTVKGTITVRELVIVRGARIDGDVHYETLTMEPGATVDGRLVPTGGAATEADSAPLLTLAS